MPTDDETTVRALLAAAGIAPPDDEVDAMIQMYPTLRASADALYTPEASRSCPRTYPPTRICRTRRRRQHEQSQYRRRSRTQRPRCAAARPRASSSPTALLARADAHDATLGTYVARFDDTALAAAAQADADFAAGVDRGALQGIPLGVKDIIAPRRRDDCVQQGARSRLGPRRRRARWRACERREPSSPGRRRRWSSRWAAPDADGPFPIHRNPWDLERWPGGSSVGHRHRCRRGPDPRRARQ